MYSSSPLFLCNDFGNVVKFHVLLGPACNMHCRHCSQTDEKTVKRFSGSLSLKTWQTLKNFIQYSSKFLSSDKFCLKRKIIFWGGESLLHWDVIQDIVLRAQSELGFTVTDGFQFSIVSNGLLLTPDKVDFINRYHIGFCFSYDAPHSFAIRDYVSDDICSLVRKIKGYAVHCSSNAINDDPMLSYLCLKAKFPDAADIDINPNLMQAPGIPSDIYDWNWEHIKDSVRYIRIAMQLGNQFAYNLVTRYWFDITFPSLEGVECLSADTCSLGNKLFNTTLAGDVLACYNSFAKIGTIDDSPLYLHEKSKQRLLAKASPDCKTCPHLDICRGNRCWVNEQNSNHQFYACQNYWLPFYSILKSQLILLSQPLSSEDRHWYDVRSEYLASCVDKFLQGAY